MQFAIQRDWIKSSYKANGKDDQTPCSNWQKVSMTAERLRQIRNVFEAALDRPAADRLAWVEGACNGDAELQSEVHALLTHYDDRSVLIDQPIFEFDPAAAGTPSRWEGRRVGPWDILREIGR